MQKEYVNKEEMNKVISELEKLGYELQYVHGDKDKIEKEYYNNKTGKSISLTFNKARAKEIQKAEHKRQLRKEAIAIVDATIERINNEKSNKGDSLKENLISNEEVKNNNLIGNNKENDKEIDNSKRLNTNNSIDKKITVTYNAKEKTYSLADSKNGYIYVQSLNKDKLMINRKKYFKEEFPMRNKFNKTYLKRLKKKLDINLYNLYSIYDAKNNTNLAETYCMSLCLNKYMLNSEEFKRSKYNNIDDINIIYNLKESTLSRKEQNKMMKLAKKAEKANIAKVIKPLLRAKKILATSVALLLAGIGCTASNAMYKQLEENKNVIQETENNNKEVDNNKITSKEDIKVPLKDSTEEKTKVSIGSKAILDNEKFTEKSVGVGKTGSMENQDNKEVEITKIVVIKDDEVKENVKDKTIEELKSKYPEAEIQIHVASKDGDLGWMNYENVQDKFEKNNEDNNKQEENKEENTNKELTFKERLKLEARQKLTNTFIENKEENKENELTEEEFERKAANWKTLTSDNEEMTFKERLNADLNRRFNVVISENIEAADKEENKVIEER